MNWPLGVYIPPFDAKPRRDQRNKISLAALHLIKWRLKTLGASVLARRPRIKPRSFTHSSTLSVRSVGRRAESEYFRHCVARRALTEADAYQQSGGPRAKLMPTMNHRTHAARGGCAACEAARFHQISCRSITRQQMPRP